MISDLLLTSSNLTLHLHASNRSDHIPRDIISYFSIEESSSILPSRQGLLFFHRDNDFYFSTEKWYFNFPSRNDILYARTALLLLHRLLTFHRETIFYPRETIFYPRETQPTRPRTANHPPRRYYTAWLPTCPYFLPKNWGAKSIRDFLSLIIIPLLLYAKNTTQRLWWRFIPKTHMFSIARIIIELISTEFLNLYNIVVTYSQPS